MVKSELVNFQSSDYYKFSYDKFVNKKIIFHKNFGDIPINGDIWSCGPQDNRTWQWTLHAFVPFDPIISAQDTTLLNKLVHSWDERFSHLPEEDDFPWHDHATALRLDRLSRMALQLEDCRYTELAAKHASFLLKESFYSRHTNHGFDQALSLILAALAFVEHPQAVEWRTVGLARLHDEITFAFTEEGVHVENSPAYHNGMIANMLRARNLLQVSNLDSGDFDSLFDKALQFLVWMTRPDRFLAYLGDSISYRPSVPAALAELPSVNEVRWVASGGSEGTPPVETSKVYTTAGYAIYRSRWRPWEGHTHIIMKSGFLSRYHRQDDDLNILVHAFGEDWLIDSGLYNHNQKDPVRLYMRSALAHNIPWLTKTRVNRNEPGKEFATLGRLDLPGYEFAAEGTTSMYEGGKVTRRLLVRNANNFVIEDRFDGFEGLPRYWLFHVPADKKITSAPEYVQIQGKHASLRIIPSQRIENKVSKGFKKPFPSVTSIKLNVVQDSQVIIFGPAIEKELSFDFLFDTV